MFRLTCLGCLIFLLLPLNILSLSIEEYLEIVRENNISLKIKENTGEKSKWSKLQSYSGYLPELSVSAGLQHSQYLHDSIKADDNNLLSDSRNPNWSRNISVSLPIFLGGKRILGNLIAEENYQISQLDIEYEKLRVEAVAVAAYFKAFITQENIKLSEKSVKSAEENLRRAKLLLDSGRTTELAYLSLELNYQKRLQELENYKMEMNSAVAEMSRIAATAITFDSLEKSDENLVNSMFKDVPLEDVRKEKEDLLLKSSPVLHKMKKIEKISKYSEKMTWANFMPVISFLYSHDFGFSEKHPFRSTYKYEDDVVSLNFSWNIFRGFNDGLEWKKAVSDTVAAQLNYIDSLNTQINTLENILVNIYSLMEQKTVSYKAVELASKALEQSRVEYENGKALYLDLLNAENSYFESLRNLVLIENSLFNSFYQLRILTGTGE
jgi:outer membrane protein